jgi:hypothetical protein
MNTKSPLVRSIGVLLALLVFVSLPTTLLAICGYADEVYCELYYGTGTNLSLELGADNPSGLTIYYTSGIDHPPTVDPTYNGITGAPGPGTSTCAPGTKIPIPYGHTLYIRALAWKYCWPPASITSCDQHNPNL